MKEIQTSFPEYARTSSSASSSLDHHHSPAAVVNNNHHNNDTLFATANFAEHSLRRLQLPPVAEASIRTLLLHCREEQVQLGRNSGTKLSTLCAAVAYFVCSAGSIMQRLAQQVPTQPPITKTTTTTMSTYTVPGGQQLQQQPFNSSSTIIGKKRALASNVKIIPRKRLKQKDPPPSPLPESSQDMDHQPIPKKKASVVPQHKEDDSDDDSLDHLKHYDDDDDDDEEQPFDVFSHAPIVLEDRSEKQEYEMRRMWDAWREQMPWSRSVVEIEQSCGVSRNSVLEFYKSDLHPRRDALLSVLKDAVSSSAKEEGDDSSNTNNNNKEANSLQDTPLAPILLVQISTAAPLMSSK
jgi:hypothetical protein